MPKEFQEGHVLFVVFAFLPLTQSSVSHQPPSLLSCSLCPTSGPCPACHIPQASFRRGCGTYASDFYWRLGANRTAPESRSQPEIAYQIPLSLKLLAQP